jgi:hypothetical protein
MKPLTWLKIANNIRPINDHQVAKALVSIALATSDKSVERFLSGQLQEVKG